MSSCPELIVTPCLTCGAHVLSWLCYDDRGHAVITCPNCRNILFDREYNETSDRFIKNQRSYYALAAEMLPEFRELKLPGDKVRIDQPEEAEN